MVVSQPHSNIANASRVVLVYRSCAIGPHLFYRMRNRAPPLRCSDYQAARIHVIKIQQVSPTTCSESLLSKE